MSPEYVPKQITQSNKYSDVIKKYRNYVEELKEKFKKRDIQGEKDRLEEMMYQKFYLGQNPELIELKRKFN